MINLDVLDDLPMTHSPDLTLEHPYDLFLWYFLAMYYLLPALGQFTSPWLCLFQLRCQRQ